MTIRLPGPRIHENESSGNRLESNSALKWARNFTNRDRKLSVLYRFTYSNNENDGILQSVNRYLNAGTSGDSINQEKNNSGDNKAQFFSIIYTEPFSKKIKVEFSSDLLRGGGTQNKKHLMW
jgi:hypothetical protein